jgi:hypothetical protein
VEHREERVPATDLMRVRRLSAKPPDLANRPVSHEAQGSSKAVLRGVAEAFARDLEGCEATTGTLIDALQDLSVDQCLPLVLLEDQEPSRVRSSPIRGS